MKIAESQRDIRILNRTSAILKKEVTKLFLKTESNTLKLTLLSVQTVINHYLKSCENFCQGITDALEGRLSSKFISLLDLRDNLADLKEKASNEGYRLSCSSTLEIPNLPLTLILNTTHLNLILSVPVESPASEYILHEYIQTPLPIQINNLTHFLIVKPTKSYLAINSITNKFIELDENDLKSCLSFSQFLHCPTLIETVGTAQTCLLSLYNNQLENIKKNCPAHLRKRLVYGKRLNRNQRSESN